MITRLRELELQEFTPHSTLRLSAGEYAEYNSVRNATAKELADRINKLSNIDRVIEKSAYHNAINAAISECNSEDTQYILKFAKSYFREKYGEEIKRRGESPELIDQIIKRLEKEGREEFEKALSGFNVEELIEKIYTATPLLSVPEHLELTQTLEQLPDHQLQELIYRFRKEHSYRCAKVLKSCLSPQGTDLTSIKLLFNNKTGARIAEIISCYEDLFILSPEKNPLSFEQYLAESGASQALQSIKPFLEGYQNNTLAQKISWILNNLDKLCLQLERISQKSQFIYSVLHDYSQISKPEFKELYARPFINSLIYDFTTEQFHHLNTELKDSHGIELLPELYLCNAPQNIFKSSQHLNKSLTNTGAAIGGNEVFPLGLYRTAIDSLINPEQTVFLEDALKIAALTYPLMQLSSDNLYLLNETAILFNGKNLEELLDPLNEINPLVFKNHLALAMTGNSAGFKELSQKLFYLEEQITIVQQVIATPLPTAQTAARFFALLKGALDGLPQAAQIAFFKNFAALEKLNNLDPFLQNQLGAAQYLHLKLLLKGFKTKDVLTPGTLGPNFLKLLHYTPIEAALALKECNEQEEFKISADLQKSRIANILLPAIFKFTEVSSIKSALDLNKFSDADAQKFIDYYQASPAELEIFETAYNLLYGAWEFCLEPCQGDYRNALFFELGQKNISRSSFSAMILVFEKLPLDLLQTLQTLTRTASKDLPTLLQLQKIFREHRTKLTIIQKLFLVIDGEKSLRQRIYDFKVMPRDENLTVLLLDGFDPVKLAERIDQTVSMQNGQQLAAAVANLLASDSVQIPKDRNWQEEMYHQVCIRYEQITGTKLIGDLLVKRVDPHSEELHNIANCLYGNMFQTALKISQIFSNPEQGESIHSVLDILKILKPADIERLQDAYLTYFGEDLESLLISQLSEEKHQNNVRKLFEDSRNWEKNKNR